MRRELETENTDNSMSGCKEQRYGAVAEKAKGVKSFWGFFLYFKEVGFLVGLISWRGEHL